MAATTKLFFKNLTFSLSFGAVTLCIAWATVISCFLLWEIRMQKDSAYNFALVEARASYNKDLVDLRGGMSISVPLELYKILAKKNINNIILINISLLLAGIAGIAFGSLNLKKKEQEIESIFRSAPTGIGVVSNRILSQVNDRVEKISGYSQKELIGQKARLLYPSDKEFEYVGEEKYRQIGIYGTGTVETKWKRKDGKIIDVLMSSTPIDFEDYSKGVTFTALDITEAKRNETALLESEEKYRSMMEAQEDPIYICSSDFRIEYMNPVMENLIGQDALNKHCYKMIHNFDKKCEWCSHHKVMEDQTTTREVQIQNTEKIYHVASAPINHNDGTVSKLSVYRDITEVKKLSSMLQQSQKMEAIGNLAGGIAHDFNNILFPILGHTEMLIADTSKESNVTINSLNQIYSSAMRAKDLIQQILTFSRQEKAVYRPLKIQLIIKEVVKLLKSTIPKNIEINQYLDRDCRKINADPTQIHQIIMNLIMNGWHAIGDDAGELKIHLDEINIINRGEDDPSLKPGNYVCLSVSDTGAGMPADLLEKIFDPFFTTKEKGKGTGMGLSVVHGIVKDMKGHIKVSSKPELGSEFKIYFPIAEPLTQNTKESPVKTIRYSGTERILIVDDEEAIIEIEKLSLERLGYRVKTRIKPLEALDTFKASPDDFDLVITDMSMPKMSGDKLVSEILSVRSDIPIILCTGYNEDITFEKAEALGVKDVMMKPVSINDLSKKIRNLLDQKI